MKKIVISIILSTIFTISLAIGLGYVGRLQRLEKAEKNPYALTTVVVELDAENDVVTCKDFNGNLWEFEGCEDWAIGDIASLLMSDRGTEKIYDDTIISARYNGYFEGWN